jgi:hypothetical protein
MKSGSWVVGTVFLISTGTSACVHQAPELELEGGGDVISEQDIARIHANTAYDAVARIHANFFSHRGQTSLLGTSNPDPNVYLDDVFLGPVVQLKGIPAGDVSTIRLYRAGQAMVKFGAGNMGGVIEVYTKH